MALFIVVRTYIRLVGELDSICEPFLALYEVVEFLTQPIYTLFFRDPWSLDLHSCESALVGRPTFPTPHNL